MFSGLGTLTFLMRSEGTHQRDKAHGAENIGRCKKHILKRNKNVLFAFFPLTNGSHTTHCKSAVAWPLPKGLSTQPAVMINTAISRELRDLARGQELEELRSPLTLII